MSDTVLIACINLFGAVVGTFGGILIANKLTDYRLQRLEESMKKYNNLHERTALVEQSAKSAHKRIDALTGERSPRNE